MPRRAHFTIKFSTDLDGLSGWGHEPQDWINLATESFKRQSHYHTDFEVLSIEVERHTPTLGDRTDGTNNGSK